MAGDMSSNNTASNNLLTNSCWNKPCDQEGGSYWGNFKNQMHIFMHTPMKDHKSCFKLALLSVRHKFSIPTNWSVDQNASGLGADDSVELPWDRDFSSVC